MLKFVSEIDPETGERVERTVEMTAEDIADAPEPVAAVVVSVVTPRQIRLALLQLGLYGAAATWIAGADQSVQIEWDYATEVRRDHAMWPVAAAALAKSADDIDQLFALAATL